MNDARSRVGCHVGPIAFQLEITIRIEEVPALASCADFGRGFGEPCDGRSNAQRFGFAAAVISTRLENDPD
jgi:hypothetical protein